MALPPPSPHRSSYMASALGHGFPSPGNGGPSHQAHPQHPQQQQHAHRPIAGLRTVTGEKRKRAQSEAADEQARANAPAGRLKLERADSAHGVGRGTSTEADDDDDDDDGGGGGGANSLDTLTFETGLSDDDGAGGSDDNDGGKKARPSSGAMVMDANGRKKIQIKYIEDKSRRHITFSKRKAGIMKKAFELSTLTGTQVLLLVVSETGLVYTFTTSKLQPLVTKPEGKNLIQACLNAPTGEAPGGGPSGPGGMTTGNRSRSSTTPGLPIRHKDDTIEYGPEPTAGSLAAAAAAAAAPASRRASASAGGRKPRGPSARSRKASTVDEAAAAAVAAGPGGGATAGPPPPLPPTTAPPPITSEMLQRREVEVAARRGGSGGGSSAGDGGGQMDPALHPPTDHGGPPMHAAHAHAHPHYLGQAFAYGGSPALAHAQPAPPALLPPYSPRTPQPPPHLAQPYAPHHPHSPYAPPPPPQHHQQQQQQQPHHHAQQGGPPPSPVHPGAPSHAQHQLYHPQQQQQQQQQQAYHHPHLQHPQDFGPPLPHQGYAYAGSPAGGQAAGAYGDPATAGLQQQQQAVGARDADAMPAADGAGGPGAAWPSSLYNS